MPARRPLIATCAPLLLCLTPACGSPSSPPVGSDVQVQLKRDVLGTATNLPVPPTTSAMNGAKVSVIGKLKRVTDEWIVVQEEFVDHWILRSNVLLVSVTR